MNINKIIIYLVFLFIPFVLADTINLANNVNNMAVIDSKRILVIDLTDDYFSHNKKSADSLKITINKLGYSVDLVTQLNAPLDTSVYSVVFCCTGMFPYNGVLSYIEIKYLYDYLANNGRLYLEGGDPWYYDPIYYGKPPIEFYFGIQSSWDGNYLKDIDKLRSIPGTFIAGYDFTYQGFVNYTDFLYTDGVNAPNAFYIWENEIDYQDGSTPFVFPAGIARNSPSGYRTIGTCFEFLGIPTIIKQDILTKYIDYLLAPVSNSTAMPSLPQENICTTSTPQERINTHFAPKIFNQYTGEVATDTLIDSLSYWDFIILNTWNITDNPEIFGSDGKLRQKNPNQLSFIYFSPDFSPNVNQKKLNTGLLSILDEEWIVKDSNGEKLRFFNLGNEWSNLLNLTSQINEVLPYYLNKHILATDLVDGIFYDWLTECISWVNDYPNNPSSPIDIDNDSIADSKEKIDENWINGIKSLLQNSKNLFPPTFPLIGNGGWKFDSTYSHILNGRMLEDFIGSVNQWGSWHIPIRSHYLMKQVEVNPQLSMFHQSGVENDYQSMRFGLTSALLFDSYFCYTSKGDYKATWWFDEYAVNISTRIADRDFNNKGYLGRPLNNAHNAKNTSELLADLLAADNTTSVNKIWRIDYENGIVLCNPSANPATLSQDELSGHLGRENIYRINGSQDPIVNSGEEVTKGITIKSNDGIILLADHINLDTEEGQIKIKPDNFILMQNYPNPFNSVSNIKVNIPFESEISLSVFDLTGRLVDNIYSGKLNPGSYEFQWNASEFSSGIYLIKLQSPSNLRVIKVILLR